MQDYNSQVVVKMLLDKGKVLMIIKEFFIDVPSRDSAPAAKIFVKMVAADQQSLTKKPFTLILPGGPGLTILFIAVMNKT